MKLLQDLWRATMGRLNPSPKPSLVRTWEEAETPSQTVDSGLNLGGDPAIALDIPDIDEEHDPDLIEHDGRKYTRQDSGVYQSDSGDTLPFNWYLYYIANSEEARIYLAQVNPEIRQFFAEKSQTASTVPNGKYIRG